MLKIIEPETPDQLNAVRRLCWDYRDFLLTLDEKSVQIVQTFYPKQKYARLMDNIEVDHAPPNGGIKLAVLEGEPIGSGMFHTIAPGVAEIKRVYVTDAARGSGAGRAIMLSLIETCRDLGFDYIRMDTGKPLEAATQLYLSLGFTLRDAYSEIPEIARDHLIFFEMSLTKLKKTKNNDS
ncbi:MULTISPECIES: GNAT family N-acetyltransferase [unclassified Ruegeria]|uniref:GNAT family N-acetyltransferase n=1 Tax=unclassified Ruegeria TaxID=2625375 RepID=UPI0014931234|nr:MULTISPECIES: GNAT family N-acetyltransferase [unclassified Ruegeria]NOD46506.1 GNAT family N-acetyltransferase [Ruegeria sp. HKCCD5849]NOD50194.1 GNAT family N-acetyltransferase [Ruegeria sp. HKCCD5851]NOD67029.1 GNAT family N-acetyltransferase [Ruegeria sp. HKCCD7303]